MTEPHIPPPNYQEWWEAQVRILMPRWISGRPAAGTTGYVWWPLPPEEMMARLEHLATMKAHS